MNLLLDTCTFLWLALQPGRLSAPAVTAIDDSANLLFISHVSIWEISLKYSAAKLPLPACPRLWISPRLSFFQVEPVPLEMEAIMLSGELPRVHSDPFDRLLAAHAISRGFTLVTPDLPLSQLGASCLW